VIGKSITSHELSCAVAVEPSGAVSTVSQLLVCDSRSIESIIMLIVHVPPLLDWSVPSSLIDWADSSYSKSNVPSPTSFIPLYAFGIGKTPCSFRYQCMWRSHHFVCPYAPRTSDHPVHRIRLRLFGMLHLIWN